MKLLFTCRIVTLAPIRARLKLTCMVFSIKGRSITRNAYSRRLTLFVKYADNKVIAKYCLN